MSLPVATTISGIDSMRVLRQNIRIASGFKPMSDRQMAALRKRVSGRGRGRAVRAVQDDGDARRARRPEAARISDGEERRLTGGPERLRLT